MTNIAFKTKLLTLDPAAIMPSKQLTKQLIASKKYQTILASIKAIGLVEPPVITFKNENIYLLDGHIRVHILKALDIKKVDCLVSTDDESYTYNRHISHISNVQERNMIQKAIDNGVSPEKLAAALGIDVKTLENRKNLLEHIHPDVVEMFKTRRVPTKTFSYLKKMKDVRQIEVARFMCSAGNFSMPLAHHFWVDTKPEMLRVQPLKRNMENIERLATLENSVTRINQEYKQLYTQYGQHAVRLQIARAYVRELFGNSIAQRYMDKNHPDILRRFKELIELDCIDDIKSPDFAESHNI